MPPRRPSSCAALLFVVCAAGCGRDKWPAPPPVDQAKYQQEYADFKKEQLETAAYALPLVGAWSLDEGDTTIPRAGVFHRKGNDVTVTPAVAGPPFVIGTVHYEVFPVPPDGMMVTGSDAADPLLKNLEIETYPIGPKWRVAARFEAFDKPKVVSIASTRGPAHDQTAPGQLVFQVDGREFRLTALTESGSDQFFVMFKDDTNGKTTFSGYRMLSAPVVPNGQWTVLDFNMARNPPCAYSKFTMCPLPPRENRIAMAVEAGVKRHPTARGYDE